MADTSRVARARPHPLHTFDAFQNHSYRLLWLANFFSYISRWMQMILLVWLVLELTSSPWRVALVGFFAWAPMLLLGAIGGVLADKLNRHRLLVATQLLSLSSAVAMTLLLQTNSVSYWYAYPVILLTGIGWSLDMPSRRSLIHDLMGRSGVTNAVALDSVGMHSSRMLGPALAGALIALIDVSGGYIVVSAFYVVAVILIWFAKLPQRSDRLRGSPNILRNLVEGIRYVRGSNAILATVLVTLVMNVLLFPYLQMVPVIARDVLGVGPGLMGILLAADGFGGLIGAVLIASTNISYHGRVYLGGSLVSLIAVLLFSFSHSYFLSLPILILLGLGTAGFGTMQAVIVMLTAREDMRGRALGVISLGIGASPVGALMIGGIATAVSAPFAVGFHAVLGIVSLSLIALLMPSLRQRIAPEEMQVAREPHPL